MLHAECIDRSLPEQLPQAQPWLMVLWSSSRHGKGTFSWKGIKIAADFFTTRGHEVHVVIPRSRKRPRDRIEAKLIDQLDELIVWTPFKKAPCQHIVHCYDDRLVRTLHCNNCIIFFHLVNRNSGHSM